MSKNKTKSISDINAEVYPITEAYLKKYEEIKQKIMTKRIQKIK